MATAKAFQAHGKTLLQDFRISEPGVGHVALETTSPSKPLPGTTPTGNGFVVLKTGIPKAEVVHGALGGRHHTHRRKQQIAQGLGGFHIPRHHRRRSTRVQQATGGHREGEGPEATSIERNRLLHQTAHHIKHRCLGDRQRRMEVVIPLG